jgi:hypothetical protein
MPSAPAAFGLCPDVNLVRLGDGVSPLHAAAAAGAGDVVTALLHRGADPCKRDFRGRRPYQTARGDARRAMRGFRAAFPGLWPWQEAGVPGNEPDQPPRADAGPAGAKGGSQKPAKRNSKRQRARKQKEMGEGRESREESKERKEGKEEEEREGKRGECAARDEVSADEVRMWASMHAASTRIARALGIPEHVLWLCLQGRGVGQDGVVSADESIRTCRGRLHTAKMLTDEGAEAPELFLGLGWEAAAAVSAVGDGWDQLEFAAPQESTMPRIMPLLADSSSTPAAPVASDMPQAADPLTPEQKRKLLADAARRRRRSPK